MRIRAAKGGRVRATLAIGARSGESLPMKQDQPYSEVEEAPVVILDRATMDGAIAMIDAFGGGAEGEAQARAEHCRETGNAVRYGRWRQTARLIALLDSPEAVGTIQ